PDKPGHDDRRDARVLIARHSEERRRFARPKRRRQRRDFGIFDRYYLIRRLYVAKAAYCKYRCEVSLLLSAVRLNRTYKSHTPYCLELLPYADSLCNPLR